MDGNLKMTKEHYQNLLNDPNILRSLKYHVPSRGALGNDNIWRLYIDIKNGHTLTEYVESIKLIGVKAYTGENIMRVGYALFAKGAVTFDFDPKDNFRRYGVIHDGTYVQKYTKEGKKL